MPTVYGIPNCDTIKKARKWLEAEAISYEFHDYRKNGLDINWLNDLVEELGWQALINRRGLTWRKLDEVVKDSMANSSAVQVMLDNPAIIKRPLLIGDGFKHLGFDAKIWEQLLK